MPSDLAMETQRPRSAPRYSERPIPITIAHAIAGVNSTRLRSARYSLSMDVKDVRLERLHELLAEHGNNKAALARTLKKAPAQVSQWFNGVRTITEESARDIEKEAKKPVGWLDARAQSGQAEIQTSIAQALMALPAAERHETLDYMRFKIERSAQLLAKEEVARYLAAIDAMDDTLKTG